MHKLFGSLTRSIFVLTIVFSAFIFIRAQNPPPPAPPPAGYNSENTGDKKGSLVRGRVFYQDTASPVRRGWIGLVKIRELVEKQDGDGTRAVTVVRSSDDSNYVLTNDEGEFVIKNVQSGIYQPSFKVQGVLNASFSDGENPLYPLIVVDGISEVSAEIPARRGGSVSGRISYSSGDPVIGARVQITNKAGRTVRYNYGSDDTTTGVTDDRGAYRFAGLPAGEYVVRVVEPSVHNESNNSVSGYNTGNYASGSMLTTFYPGVPEIERAQTIVVSLGGEQGDINIAIPDRRLFKISGTAAAKNTRASLKNLKVTFQKIGGEELFINYDYDESKQTKTDERGGWSFVDLPKGKYLIKVSRADSYDSATGKLKTDDQPKLAPATKEIEIDNENLSGIVLEMAAESAISGTITVEGGKEFPKYVSLAAFDEQTKVNSSTSVNNHGDKNKPQQPGRTRESFRIGALSAGKYYLNVKTSDDFYIKSMRANGNIDLLNSPIEIHDGKEIGDVQIVLASDLGTLKGKITDYAPTEPTFVVLLPVGKSGSNAFTNARQAIPSKTGDFTVRAAPGEYYVIIGTSRNRPKNEKIAEWLAELTVGAPKVTVKTNETATITLNPAKD